MEVSRKPGTEGRYMMALLIGAAFVLSNVAFILYASYPGYLNPDSVYQLVQVHTGKFEDWHPPFSTLVLYATHSLVPGPFGYAILVNVLIWGGIALLAYTSSQRIGPWALLLLVIPYLPGAYNMLGNVHKDVLLVAWLLAGSALGYMANQAGLRAGKKTRLLVVSNLLLVAAFLTRPNTIFAIVPLLFYINHGFGWRRNLTIGVSLLLLMPFMQIGLLKLTQAKALHPGDSVKTHHLLGLSYLEGENLFPGKWSEVQARKIAEACYTPVQWDTAALWGKCGFIQEGLNRQKLWGSSALTQAWLSEVIDNPLALFNLMSASFYRSLYYPNSRSMFYNPEMPELFNWAVEMDPPRRATALLHDYVKSKPNDRLGRPFVFVCLSVAALTLLTCARTALNTDGLFAMAVLCSGLLNTISYFALTVSAEYRYFYWSGFAVYIGLILTMLSLFLQNRGTTGRIPIANWLKIGVFTLLGVSIGLVAAARPFPSLDRQVSLTPLDEGTITLKSLRRASIPDWMRIGIDGDLSAHDWQTDEEGRPQGSRKHGTLTATIPTQGKAIEIEMQAEASGGRVLVESDGLREVVKLDPSSEKSRTVYVWPTPSYDIMHNHILWLSPLTACLTALFSLGLLYWIDRRFKRAW